MPVSSPLQAPTLADPLAARVIALEQRLAALEAVVVQSPGGGVAIVAPAGIRIQAGTALSLAAGTDLTLACGRGLGVTTGHGVTITAGGLTTFMSGSATFTMRPSGDIDIAGNKISVRGTGPVVLKGSKILQN